MKKTLRKVILLTVLLLVALTLTVHAATPGMSADAYPGRDYFFANGAAITISARADSQPGATISWDGGSLDVGPETYVFGGMHNDDTAVTSNITMNGGTVKHIAAGGLHLSNTTTSNLTINGGTVSFVSGGGVGSGASIGGNCTVSNPNCQGYPQEADATQAACKTGTSNVTINGGTINTVYGGGLSGITKTEKANVKVTGGTISYVVGGGSNGYTGSANVTISGGTVACAQSVNRGTMNSANMEVTGGNVTNLYVGGESDSSVTGTINEVKLTVEENANVGNLSYGYNGGTEMDTTSGNINSEDVKVSASANVGNMTSVGGNVTLTYTVTIDGKAYSVDAGKTVSSIPGYNSLITKDGYTFKGLKNGDADYDVTKSVTSDLTLVTSWEKVVTTEPAPSTPAPAPAPAVPAVEKDNTPKTGVVDFSLYIAAIIGTVAFIGIVAIKKSSK